jgi:hypothetical protein
MWKTRKEFINIDCNSNPTSGSVGLSSDGSTFTVQMTPALTIPKNAYNIRTYLNSASIWYSFLNINASNNTFYFTDNTATPTKYPVVLQNGLYSLDLLNASIQLGIQNWISISGANFPNNQIITLTGDTASQKVVTVTTSGYQVYWGAGSFWNLCGETLNLKQPASGLSTGTISTFAPNVGNFSNLTQLAVSTSLTNSYIYNGALSSVLSVIPINASPNSLINYNPTPDYLFLNTPELCGAKINQVTLKLTDQNLNVLNTNGEYYLVTITISYDIYEQ